MENYDRRKPYFNIQKSWPEENPISEHRNHGQKKTLFPDIEITNGRKSTLTATIAYEILTLFTCTLTAMYKAKRTHSYTEKYMHRSNSMALKIHTLVIHFKQGTM